MPVISTRAFAGLAAWGIALGVVGAAGPAMASSLPRVDFGTSPSVGLGFGANQALQAGGSLSVDVPVGQDFLVGGALSSTITGGIVYDARALYRFVEGDNEGPSIAAMVGIWGSPGLTRFQLPISAAPLVGFGLAYPITPQFDIRLNLAYSPFFNYGPSEFLGFIGGPPGTGIEVGYQIMPNIEATLGINGRGDLLGLNMTF